MRTRTRSRLDDYSGPFRGSLAVAAGEVTKKQLRSGLVQRLFQDVYAPSAIPITHQLRCLAASLVVPGNSVLTGCSAFAVRGVELGTAYEPVEFLIPEEDRFVAHRGMDVRRVQAAAAEHEPWNEIRLASPLRASLDILANTRLRSSLPRTVGLLDAVLRAELVDQDELGRLLADEHEHGIVRARKAFALVDPRAESIPESEVRVLLVNSGLHPEPQLEVFAGTSLLGRLDLAFEDAKLAVEYDGEWHQDGAQPLRDAGRRARFEEAGWEFVIVTRRWLRDDPGGIVRAVRDALRRRA